jgi:ribosomal protein S18 acetylase RimI-like enzyme
MRSCRAPAFLSVPFERAAILPHPGDSSNGSDMVGTTIRRAGESDRATVGRLASLLQDAESDMHPSRRTGKTLPHNVVDELYRRTCVEKGGAILLAEAGSTVTGYIAFYPERQANIELRPEAYRFLYVADLCVVPEARGQRIAGLLLAEAEAICRRLCLPRVALGVLAANPAARAAYDRAGYLPYELWLEKSIAKSPIAGGPVAGLTLRQRRDSDRETMLAFLRDLSDAEALYHWAMRSGGDITMADVDRTIAEIADEDGAIFVAELDGRPVGYAGAVLQNAADEFELKDEWRKRGFVTDMYVDASARGRGVGLALLAECDRYVAAAGIDWQQICVSPDNAPAIGLYRKAGFDDYEMVLEKRLIR